ncbi:stage II sporulation protein M [Oceanobacillus sp. CAU 1775]
MQNYRNFLSQHIREHSIIFVFIIILFITGVIFGSVIVNGMNFTQKQDLFFYLERFFTFTINEQGIDQGLLWQESFFYHLRFLGILGVLGLSIIGLPIVWILIFIKGLVIGFSVGFIVSQLGGEGFLFVALSIIPHNLIIVPVYLIAGSLTMIFSLLLFKKIFSNGSVNYLRKPFFNYIIVFSMLFIVSSIAALIESYVSMGAMEILIKSFYL